MRNLNTLYSKGSITPAILVITGSFLVVIYGLLLLLTQQMIYSNRQYASEVSLNIAEAGINYYRWHLAHDPLDFQDGTGLPGPYEHEYFDPQGKSVGYYSLDIVQDNSTGIVTLRSTGRSHQFPNITRTIEAQYGKPSFTRYSFLTNSSVWYGTGSTVNGDIHSNNGVRMDGDNNGRVTSGKDNYMCGTETGCHPPQQQDGVWGTGDNNSLWQFPVPTEDFSSVAFDFNQMKSTAQSSGLYLPPSGNSGYKLVVSGNTLQVERVRRTNNYRAYLPTGQGLGRWGQGGCRNYGVAIRDTEPVGSYDISNIDLIFIEDNIWIEGNVTGRVTIAAAGFPTSSADIEAYITNNITYDTYDGSTTFGLISQSNIFFLRDLPTDFQIDGAYMAQGGGILRHGYLNSCGGTSTSIRDSLTVNGALISYDRSFWNYGSPLESGFTTREINYDADLLYNPPPYFPTSSNYQFISWKEL